MVNEAEIIDGIKKDEFCYFYQPKISLLNGKVFGAEALIRWIKPDGSIVLPDEYIPLAEQTSLIKDITQHMFPKLMKDLLVMLDVEQLSVSFNVSAKDFEDDVFIKMILKSLEISRLPPSCLQVELTETAALQAGDRIKKYISPLNAAGVGLAMDDFGKGYSSLDTLSKWPFTTIKLDQGIVSRMFESDKNLTIVESSIRMAHELGISVVAEGVENSEQYHRLIEAGCTKVQGFWLCKPLPLDQYIYFVKEDIHWSGLPVGLIHMAIIDHMQWRRKLISGIVRAASYPKDSPHRQFLQLPPLSHKDCRLGHWYDGVGQMFQDRQSFRNLQKPHIAFHDIGKLLVDLVGGGASMEEIAPHLQEFSERSIEVLSLLHALEIEGMIEMHVSHGNWILHSQHPIH